MSIWPPIIMLILMGIGLVSTIEHWGETKEETKGPGDLFAMLVSFLLLYWGGFWAPLFGGAK